MAAQIITIAIEKGGAGKTVTASNLAYLMGDEGKKVLCILFHLADLFGTPTALW